MKVNMTPNPLDVVTIHASQGDTEARQWEFELHNNGELIDTSDVKEQMVFKAYKGGTEQLLPENTSTPTTSPFKGDIKYPQGLLSDQEFTYRQSPTEEDGLAKITDIKGNTLVWNQLVQNGNFADTSNWSSSSDVPITASNNILRVTNAAGRNGDYYSAQNIAMKVGHKYCFHAEAKKTDVSTAQTLVIVFFGEASNVFAIDALTENANWISKSTIFTCVSNTYNFVRLRTQAANATNEFRNVMLIDLTQMGLDSITDPSEFTSLFSLPYYAYNQGSLLSFMGNGIKTVGKNLFNKSTDVLNAWVNTATQTLASGSNYRTAVLRIMPNTTYTISKTAGKAFRYALFSEYPVLETTKYNSTNANHTASSITFTSGNNDRYLAILFWSSGNGDVLTPEEMTSSVMVEIGSSATSCEPYAESTLSLPISTYFSNGMKSAGNVYDELTPIKAITRIGAVDMGTLSWSYVSANRRFVAIISDAKSSSSLTLLENIVSAKYENATWENILTQAKDKIIALHYTSNNSYVAVIDNGYSDAPTFKSAMSGVMLYYELATPTETPFTTASLVTENAEIPLSNEDGVLVGKCTEQLSSESGFFDAKIKLADGDGDVYSNKIQLHVERSPQ